MLDPGLGLDLQVTPRGEIGTLTSHGVTWRVVALDGAMWMRGRALWNATLPPDRAAAFGDSWVAVDDGEAGFGWARFLPAFPRQIVAQVFGPHDALRIAATTRFGGRDAVELRGGKDLYDIAATGTPWPLRWLDADIPGPGGQPCGVTLDRFGEPVALAPPSPVIATLTPAPSPGA